MFKRGNFKGLSEFSTVALYYFGTRFGVVILVVILVLLNNPYGVDPKFVVFILSLYTGWNIYQFLKQERGKPDFKTRLVDYLLALVLIFFSRNLLGLLPAITIAVTYSFLHLTEYLFLLGTIVALLLVKTYLLGNYKQIDFVISAFFIAVLSFAASKVNLLEITRGRLKKLLSLRREMRELQKDYAAILRHLKNYEEAEEILAKISTLRRTDRLDRVLANLLNAEEVIVATYNRKMSLSPEEFITFQLGEGLIVAVKPRFKFLVKDKHYRKKTEITLRMIKPYLESFLAKSK